MKSALPTAPTADSVAPEKFDELLVRLRAVVERLEGGHISLEDGLRCFEEGMTLCKRGADILDQAERRVEILLGSGAQGPRTAPFEGGANMRGDQE